MSDPPFRPGPDNRHEAVRLMRAGIVASADVSRRNRDQMIAEFMTDIASGQARPVSIGAGAAFVFFDSMNLACVARIQGKADAEGLMQMAFSEGYWGFEVLRHGWGEDYTLPTRVMAQTLALCGLCFAGGRERLGDGVADFALRSIEGIGDYEIRETDVLNSHRVLLSARMSGAWPLKHKIARSLEEFRDLLVFADKPDALAPALLAYLDLRLSRSWRFADRTAKLPKRPREASSYFENLWFSLIPTELFLFSAACEKCFGFKPDLAAARTVLLGDLQPPAYDLRDSEFSHAIRTFGLRTFGSEWRPTLSRPTG